jgi:hypothetical protein
MADIIASLPARIIEVAEAHPIGLAAAVLMTAATIMQAIRIFKRSGS